MEEFSHFDNTLTERLIKCECCPRKCGVNRLNDESGFCGISSDILVSHSGLHFGEEPPVSGINGSGTIFFAGCNLSCVFCQNYQISQEFKKEDTRCLTGDELALEMIDLEEKGAHNINFVSPSHMIYQMADAIKLARRKGLLIPIVYNSNGYDSIEVLREIKGLIDIYLPDFKYMDNRISGMFSKSENYADIVTGVLMEMLDQVGHLKMDTEGIATKGLLVRHLVLPGHLENSRKCLRFLSELSPDIFVSIMSQYSPQFRACSFPEIDRTLTKDEYGKMTDLALSLGLKNLFLQEIGSQDQYLPDFSKKTPFDQNTQ